MTTASHYQTTGLSVHMWKPTVTWASGSPNTATITPRGSYQGEITNYSALSFVHKATGGFWSGSCSLPINQIEAEWWLENGIGMHIEIVEPGATVVWAGFVNSLSLTLAGLSVTKGPLLDAGNRCVVSYAPIDTVPAEPTLGTRTNTAIGENSDSQRKYGILYAYLSTGGVTDTEALQIRDLFLAENAEPKVSRSLSLSGSAQPSALSLECAGYVQTFGQWPYNQTLPLGLGNLSTKLAAVIDADPNNLFSSANAAITSNAIQVPRWESKDRDAWTVIQGLVDLGDITDVRYLFQVGEGQYITYAAMPTSIEYHQRITDNRQIITTPTGQPVPPWNVLAGKWVLVPDFLVGSSLAADLRTDYRAMFVEQLTFTSPDGLELQGGDADRITQLMARYGLDGLNV